MSIGIYKIECVINHKVYIGQSVNVEERWKHHIYQLNKNNHGNKYLQRAWNKYGSSNFKFEIIKKCRKINLNFYETYYWEQYKNKSYNLHRTGDAHNMTDEIKEKIRKSMLGKKRPKEICDKIGKGHLGLKYNYKSNNRKHSEKTKQKISEAMKRIYKTTDLAKRISISHIGIKTKRKGVKHSEETKKKISISIKKYLLNKQKIKI